MSSEKISTGAEKGLDKLYEKILTALKRGVDLSSAELREHSGPIGNFSLEELEIMCYMVKDNRDRVHDSVLAQIPKSLPEESVGKLIEEADLGTIPADAIGAVVSKLISFEFDLLNQEGSENFTILDRLPIELLNRLPAIKRRYGSEGVVVAIEVMTEVVKTLKESWVRDMTRVYLESDASESHPDRW